MFCLPIVTVAYITGRNGRLFQYVVSAAEAGVDFNKWNLRSYSLENIQFAQFQVFEMVRMLGNCIF